MLADDLRAAFLTGGLTRRAARRADRGRARTSASRAGDELFREGEPADLLWILLEGSIELSRRIGQRDGSWSRR